MGTRRPSCRNRRARSQLYRRDRRPTRDRPQGALPAPPLNLVGDYAGAAYLAFGLLAAVLNARRTGTGQVVDAAMVDCTAHLLTSLYGMHAAGAWKPERGTNVLDSGAPYYDTYRCGDGRLISVAAIEPKFYAQFLKGLGLDAHALPKQDDRESWKTLRNEFAARLRTRSRNEWLSVFAGTDACVAAVLTLDEAPSDPHLAARATFITIDGITQPALAPRFSATPAAVPEAPQLEPAAEAGLEGWLSREQIISARAAGVLG